MEKFPSSGSPFSPLSDSDHARLRAIADSPTLEPVRALLGHGQFYLVGGTVRDALLGHVQSDLDLATNLRPEVLQSLLTKAGIRVVETGLEHGTITAVLSGENVEFTTFRKPNPRNEPGYSETIEEDLSGRDFTINALAFSLSEYSLVDPFQGAQDLRAAVLKCVGDPSKRFEEDPLRILRMIRFGPAQGRSIAPETWNAGRALVDRLEAVPVERIKTELSKILLCDFPGDALRQIERLGALPIVVPELVPSVGMEQNEFHVHDVFEHTISVVERAPKDLILRLAALYHDSGKPHTLSVDDNGRRHFYQHESISTDLAKAGMKHLRFSNSEIEDVATIVRHHMRPLECGPAGVRRILRDLGPLFDRWLRFKYADAPPVLGDEDINARLDRFMKLVEEERARENVSPYQNLCIKGDDIMLLGVPQGKKVGMTLKYLHEAVLDDPSLNTKDILLVKAREYLATLD